MSTPTAETVFTFALRAGDLMVRNGSPSANVTSVLLAITRAMGYPGATATVTMGELGLSLTRPDSVPITQVHSVGAATFNLEAVTQTEQVVKAVIMRDLPIEDGLASLEAIGSTRLGHTPPIELAGWGLMSAGFAWLLGGHLTACVLASITSVVIELLAARLARAELPGFFSHVLAGAAAVAAAVVTQLLSPGQMPGLVITAALVSRLAGAATFGAAQDLLTGWYITAAGRILELALNTAGQVVGVILMANLANRLDVGLNIERLPDGSPGLVHATTAAVVISVGFCIASQLRWRRIPAVIVLTSIVYPIYQGAQIADFSRLVAAAAAATTLGAITVLVAPFTRIPSAGALGVVLAPLLPGMLVYIGFVSIALDRDGASDSFLQAAGVALSTGAGAVLGQYLAAQILAHLRTPEIRGRRLAGPDVDDAVMTARWLSAPTFRRPYVTDALVTETAAEET
ncbi:threonine/serine exporter family protein [Mobilicoccus massiliensis]|uniref:threonine/serine ThrE exporter family protein n=1 Tax=Mobilicoccus massiliensis TaxID=1522310 RepID=UPI00058FB0E2|nr:threonine/serine exporter family protein [Mobilicoccus massiliensis]